MVRPAIIIFSLLLTWVAAYAQGEAPPPVGEACVGCHEAQVKDFVSNVHSKAGFWQASFQGCDACHGPSGDHIAAGGDKSKIVGPATWTPAQAATMCLGCHEQTKHIMYWRGSRHQTVGVSCPDCHRMHGSAMSACGPRLLRYKTEMEVCLCCHADMRLTLTQRSRHPMRDSTRSDFAANMTCSDCHNPHGAVGDKLIDALSVNDKCYECHLEKKAPVIWEHAPVKEDCLVCHKPHGSNQQNLLVEKVPRLCQTCHFQGRHQTVAGAQNQIWAINRGCVNCHPMIHGSNNPSAVKLDR